MTITYQSPNYDPASVVAKYARLNGDKYRVVETNAAKFTIREMDTDGHELPEDVRHRADKAKGAYVSFDKPKKP